MSQHYLVIIVTQSFATHTTNSCKRQVSIDGELLFVIVIFNETLHTLENRVENAWLFGGKKCEKCRKPYQNVECQGKELYRKRWNPQKASSLFFFGRSFYPRYVHTLSASLSLFPSFTMRTTDKAIEQKPAAKQLNANFRTVETENYWRYIK